jgi:diguanylate cyclase (GGDEF)-like protein
MPETSGEETISQELDESCAREAIHTIGTVQPHGFLIVADVQTARIVQVSSGIAGHWPGLLDAARLFDAPLSDWVAGFDSDPSELLSSLPGSVPIALSLRPQMRESERPITDLPHVEVELECIGHQTGGFAVLEWQPRGGPIEGDLDAGALITVTRSAIARLRGSTELGVFYSDCVREVSRLSGFDRVMIYRFLPDWSGEVIAEHVSGTLETRFLGLRFPASDIPSQARRLYTANTIRVLADVRATPDTLQPHALPGGAVLDQSHSLLRGFSEVHLLYLRNMGVCATMTLSILCDGKLWGLIACHHYTPRVPPYHVRATLRHLCELVADISTMRVEALNQIELARELVHHERLLSQLHDALLHETDLRVVLDQKLPEFLSAFDASAFCLRVDGLDYTFGQTAPGASPTQILDELSLKFDSHPIAPSIAQWTGLLASGVLPLTFLPAAAGLLAAQQPGAIREICAFTRAEVSIEVRWAGAPVKRALADPNGDVRLEPRRSFALWNERVAGTARAWSRAESEACQRLLRALSEICRVRLNLKLEEALKWRADHDHLTGLYNRRVLEENLNQRMGASRYDAALMLIDLDNFKKINDTRGHAAGDLLLKELSVRLAGVIRPGDTLARLGGDEFMLIAEIPMAEATEARAISERLHKAVGAPFQIEGESIQLGISIGIAIPPDHGTSATDLMRRADLALYRAKKLGRSQSVIFDAALETALLGTYELERDLQLALDNDQFSLVYQPKVHLGTGRVVGLEALLRFTNPRGEEIGPSVFIPVAERGDLILQIGQWVLRSAVAAQAHWLKEGILDLPVAINVSMAQVMTGTLASDIGRALSEFNVPARALEIELTESVIMKDLGFATRVLLALRQLGICTSLDDFGTGYSSLSHLRDLPLTCLKIDQSFTEGLTNDPHSRNLTEAIVRMAEALKLTTIAEGVETYGQFEWLSEQGCTEGQGFLFSPGVSVELIPGVIQQIESGWQAMLVSAHASSPH